jgi:2-hydroxy-3-keto-5-methylthiopentenyl-1-phosphate phosphatase
MVKADKETLIAYTRRHSQLRAGFKELLDFCKKKGVEFVIVSNGMDFYIETLLNDLGLNKLETLAGRTEFDHKGITVRYIGPEGNELTSGFKEAYTRLYINRGYRIVYIGNGISDIPAARLSYRVFAREDLLEHCSETNLKCIPFNDLNDVIKGLADIDR